MTTRSTVHPGDRAHPRRLPILLLNAGALGALMVISRSGIDLATFSSVTRFSATLDRVGAVATAAQLVLILTALGASYVLVIALLALAASFRDPTQWLAHAARLVTVPALRWTLPGVVGMTTVMVPTAGAATAPGRAHITRSAVSMIEDPGDDEALFVLLDDEPSTTSTTNPDEATFVLVDPTSPPSTTPPTSAVPTSTPSPVDGTGARPGRPTTTSATSTSPDRPVTSLADADGTGPSDPAVPDVTYPSARPARPVRVTTPGSTHATNSTTRPDQGPDLWTVEPGDHLWHVAAATVARHTDRATSDADTARYLQVLIEENRDVLVDPGNPDLILPGQVFRLPSPTS